MDRLDTYDWYIEFSDIVEVMNFKDLWSHKVKIDTFHCISIIYRYKHSKKEVKKNYH